MKNNLEHYQHKVGSHEHWKFRTLRRLYQKAFNQDGWAGEGKFWAFNNMIAQSDGCILDLTDENKRLETASSIDFDIVDFDKFLHILVVNCKLVKKENELYFTDIPRENLAHLNKKRVYQSDWVAQKRSENRISTNDLLNIANQELSIDNQELSIDEQKSNIENQQTKLKENKENIILEVNNGDVSIFDKKIQISGLGEIAVQIRKTPGAWQRKEMETFLSSSETQFSNLASTIPKMNNPNIFQLSLQTFIDQIQGNEEYQPAPALKRHFGNWLRKNQHIILNPKSKINGKHKNNGSGNSEIGRTFTPD